MDDSDSMFSDDSDTEIFTNEFLNSIPEDSDEEEYSFEAIENFNDDLSTLTLILEVGMTFLTWKSAYDHIKRWSLQQGFFIRQGRCTVQPENVDDQLRLNELGVDQENIDQNQIGNPIIRRPKGRPPGTARFKGPLENSSHSNEVVGGRNQNKCGLCYNIGHNRATCPSNPNRKKRRQG